MFSVDELMHMPLDGMYVRDNTMLTGLRVTEGFYGVGGSNTSTCDETCEYIFADYAGKRFPCFTFGRGVPRRCPTVVTVLAAVEDMMYLRIGEDIRTLRVGEAYCDMEQGISYDTDWRFSMLALQREPLVLETPLGRYEGRGVFGVPHGRGKLYFREDDPLGRAELDGYFCQGKAHKYNEFRAKDGMRSGIDYIMGKSKVPGPLFSDIILVTDEELANNPHKAYFDGLEDG